MPSAGSLLVPLPSLALSQRVCASLPLFPPPPPPMLLPLPLPPRLPPPSPADPLLLRAAPLSPLPAVQREPARRQGREQRRPQGNLD